MAETLALIDYGAGNLQSVANALRTAAAASGWGGEIAVTADPDVVRQADRVVLPGVGSFKACAEGLGGIDGLVEAMAARVLAEAPPRFAVCGLSLGGYVAFEIVRRAAQRPVVPRQHRRLEARQLRRGLGVQHVRAAAHGDGPRRARDV